MESVVVATFPAGPYKDSVISRYADGEYWHTWPKGGMVPGQKLSMHIAAVRVVYHGGVVEPNIPSGKRFRTEVLRIQREEGFHAGS